MYEGMSDRKRSCPAVSHSWRRTVRSSRYNVLEKKSTPVQHATNKAILDTMHDEKEG
jgi:hypothetical protein